MCLFNCQEGEKALSKLRVEYGAAQQSALKSLESQRGLAARVDALTRELNAMRGEKVGCTVLVGLTLQV